MLQYLQHGYCINYTRDRYKTVQDNCLLLPYTGKLKSVGSYKIKELQDKGEDDEFKKKMPIKTKRPTKEKKEEKKLEPGLKFLENRQ